jgi:predicted SAM-dependent methyltransferase
LPFPDGSAAAIYASHVLEHLYFEEGRQLIRESFRVLSGGGLLRIVVPDLNAIVREYLGERPFGPCQRTWKLCAQRTGSTSDC